jgi:hypothetical protein
VHGMWRFLAAETSTLVHLFQQPTSSSMAAMSVAILAGPTQKGHPVGAGSTTPLMKSIGTPFQQRSIAVSQLFATAARQ